MVGVKHEHTPAGSDGSLTCREQRAMLFRPKRINFYSFMMKSVGEEMAK
jgi:hypothetical protein